MTNNDFETIVDMLVTAGKRNPDNGRYALRTLQCMKQIDERGIDDRFNRLLGMWQLFNEWDFLIENKPDVYEKTCEQIPAELQKMREEE